MNTIAPDSDGVVSVVVKKDGEPLPISGAVAATLLAQSGEVLIPSKPVLATDAGANWAVGVVAVAYTAQETAGLPTGDAMLVLSGAFGSKTFAVSVEAPGQIVRSSLFVRDIAVERLRADSLMMAASGAFRAVKVSDDYLWDKLRAAESEIAHELRVPLVPTAFFPDTPSDAEIAALNGKPWGIDPGYDYQPADFSFNDKWGMIKLRNKPLHSVSRIRFAYPGGATAHYDLPLDWVRPDKKFGMIQFVPSSSAFAAPLNAFVMQAIGQGRTIPLAIQVTYVAGLQDASKTFPELMDVILKKTVLKVIEDSFLPSSGSISADGLSQSISNDMSKHAETVDRILNGGKGSNGGLFAAIHGIRVGVV